MNGLTRLAFVEAATGRAEDCRRHGGHALEIAEERGGGSIISMARNRTRPARARPRA